MRAARLEAGTIGVMIEGSEDSEDDRQGEDDDDREDGERLELRVDEGRAGGRADVVLASLAGVSRAQARRWIDAGRVRVGGDSVRPSRTLVFGEVIEAHPPPPTPLELVPEAIPLSILHEDAHLIVLDKPAGLVVHPAPGHPSGTLVNALLAHCGDLAGIGGVLRPGIVHRLDRGTSGVMVAAKHDEAHRALAAQFASHSIERRYRTFVRGQPRADSGRIVRPIGRHPRDRKRVDLRLESRAPGRGEMRDDPRAERVGAADKLDLDRLERLQTRDHPREDLLGRFRVHVLLVAAVRERRRDLVPVRHDLHHQVSSRSIAAVIRSASCPVT
ncbi:MAG: pseudouridine synthase, partial [bacterium]